MRLSFHIHVCNLSRHPLLEFRSDWNPAALRCICIRGKQSPKSRLCAWMEKHFEDIRTPTRILQILPISSLKILIWFFSFDSLLHFFYQSLSVGKPLRLISQTYFLLSSFCHDHMYGPSFISINIRLQRHWDMKGLLFWLVARIYLWHFPV